MPSHIYEVVAQGARYWFLFLMALIVWRSYRWYRRDRKQRKKRLRLLPDAGYVGELVVLKGGADMQRGTVMPVPCEGTLGSLRTNDLCVTVRGIAKKHLWFCFDEGDGLMVEPFRRCELSVDGEAFENRRNPLYMKHGSRLTVGEAELRLRLFAGFEAAAPNRRREDISENDGGNSVSGAVAMTPEMMQQAQQMWMRQQMMRQYAQRQAYQQWLAQQGAAGNAGGVGNDAYGAGVGDGMGDEDTDELSGAPPVETSEGVFATPMRYAAGKEKEAKYTFAPIVTGEVTADASAASYAAPAVTSQSAPYAALADDSTSEARAYAGFPQSDATFENQGYTHPEYIDREDLDEDMTDAAAPPKSAYIGHDEAENAKRKLWDKYLGGGQKR